MRKITFVYTADDEEPKCNICDHICDSEEFCILNCGGANGWAEYKRTEFKEVEE